MAGKRDAVDIGCLVHIKTWTPEQGIIELA
jgi:hypothetical protein